MKLKGEEGPITTSIFYPFLKHCLKVRKYDFLDKLYDQIEDFYKLFHYSFRNDKPIKLVNKNINQNGKNGGILDGIIIFFHHSVEKPPSNICFYY